MLLLNCHCVWGWGADLSWLCCFHVGYIAELILCSKPPIEMVVVCGCVHHILFALMQAFFLCAHLLEIRWALAFTLSGCMIICDRPRGMDPLQLKKAAARVESALAFLVPTISKPGDADGKECAVVRVLDQSIDEWMEDRGVCSEFATFVVCVCAVDSVDDPQVLRMLVWHLLERWQTPELVEDYDDDLWGFGNSDDDEWFGV